MLAAINAESQFASATLIGSTDLSFISQSGRYEAGVGIRAVGLLAGPAVLAAFAAGWRAGYEYYFTPRIALRLDNTLTLGKGIEDAIAVSNTFSVGTRLLF